MADIEYDVVGAQIDENTYTVTWTVTAQTDVPAEIFVHKYATRKFDHVANGADLQWPLAPDSTKAFYRLDNGLATYQSLNAAETAKANVASDIEDLVDGFTAGLVAFTTPVTTNYP